MWALVEDDAVTQIFRDARAFTLNDIQYASTVFILWSDQERADLGIYPIQQDPLPDKNTFSVIGSTFEFSSNVVFEHWETVEYSDDTKANMLLSKKSETLLNIDAVAEYTRLQFITSGSGQAMTYQEKYAQALDVVKTGSNISLTDFPLISAEIGITADKTGDNDVDMLAVSNVIIQNYEQWKAVGAMIEQIRLKAKKDVRAATSIPDIDSIFNALVWPTNPN